MKCPKIVVLFSIDAQLWCVDFVWSNGKSLCGHFYTTKHGAEKSAKKLYGMLRTGVQGIKYVVEEK